MPSITNGSSNGSNGDSHAVVPTKISPLVKGTLGANNDDSDTIATTAYSSPQRRGGAPQTTSFSTPTTARTTTVAMKPPAPLTPSSSPLRAAATALKPGEPRLLNSKRSQAKKLLKQLTIEQKVQLLSGSDSWHTKPIPSLDLSSILMCDGPHGLRREVETEPGALFGLETAPATCFPTASALACTWNPSLLVEMGKALRDEAIAEQVTVLLGPGMNLQRHPCGGRNFEFFSEDPFVSGTMASALVEGIQSSGRVGACLKHFAVNSQELWRFNVDAVLDDRTLHELYLRAFEICIADRPSELHPWTVMCSYNQVNGSYASEHKYLFKTILRKEWKFDGLTMTDWGASNIRWKGIAAGVDLEMPGSHGANDKQTLQALKEKDLSETALDRCALRVLQLILMGQELQQQQQEEESERSTGDMAKSKTRMLRRNHQLAYRVALETAVLLKNEFDELPLQYPNMGKDRTVKAKIAIIGNMAKHPRFQGLGSSRVNASSKNDTAWKAFKDSLGGGREALMFAKGYNDDSPDEGNDPTSIQLRLQAAQKAQRAYFTILFVGLPESYESESFDRSTMELPPSHVKLIRLVSEAARGPKNVAVVLMNGSAVCMESWYDCAGSILQAGLNGQAGGRAICDLILGFANPCGKLTQTIPLQMSDVPSDPWFPGVDHQVQHREGLNVGYRYYETATIPVRYPFGYGLSYTKFQYSDLQVTPSATMDIRVTVKVKNIGSVAGKEIVQCYVHTKDSEVYRPVLELQAFCKTELLKPGQEETCTLKLNYKSFAYWDIDNGEGGGWTVEPGWYEICIGASVRDIRLRDIISLSSATTSGSIMPLRTASFRARQTHPPVQQDGQSSSSSSLVMKDVTEHDFLRMLDESEMPQPLYQKGQRVHMNSLLGDIQHCILGRYFYGRSIQELQKVLASTRKTMKKTKDGATVAGEDQLILSEESQRKMGLAMTEGACLRTMVLWSQGEITFEMMQWLIDVTNNPFYLIMPSYRPIRYGFHRFWRAQFPMSYNRRISSVKSSSSANRVLTNTTNEEEEAGKSSALSSNSSSGNMPITLLVLGSTITASLAALLAFVVSERPESLAFIIRR